MHEPIKDHVEDYLTRSNATSLPAEFTAHLMACSECREELTAMEKQSNVIRILKPGPAELDPAPGFYARVLDRIEAQRPISIWSIFLQPFGRRLAVASLALAVLMGIYLVSTEPGSQGVGPVIHTLADRNTMLPGEDQPGMVVGVNPEQDRGAVLVNLATYQEQ